MNPSESNSHKIKCRINFRHTLSELAVNRKDPCEVIRELISNSYDAEASTIKRRQKAGGRGQKELIF